jgi:GlpG protein
MARGYTVLRVPASDDLLPFLVLLQQRRVPHRVYEAGGEQVLEVADQAQAEAVMSLYRAWRSGELQVDISSQAVQASQRPRSAQRVMFAPVTLLLMALSVAGFLLVYLRAPLDWLSLFTFAPFTLQNGAISFGSMGPEYWRLITPAFLHFGWLHIVFNSLWLWELGNKVERALGSVHMLGLFFTIALISNACQYLFGGPSIFGGMSGVVYGLLGFSFVGARLQPRWLFEPSRPIMLLMVGWLVLCLVGFVEVLGFGAIANAAHVGGLLSGAALGAGMALLSRVNPGSD